MMKQDLRLSIILITITALFLPATMPAAEIQQGRDTTELGAWLAGAGSIDPNQPDAPAFHLPSHVARFYQLVGYRPVWVDTNGLRPQGEAMWAAIENSFGDGLYPDDYLLPAWATPGNHSASSVKVISIACQERYIEIDAAMTGMLLNYATHLSRGRVAPQTITGKGALCQPQGYRGLPAELAEAVKKGRLPAFLGALRPRHKAYERLRTALQQYEQIRASGGWPQVVPGPSLRVGDQGPRVSALRRRLAMSGDLHAPPTVVDDRYDRYLKVAVMRFQLRHGLFQDGIVGRQTLAALSIPLEMRILQLQLNMERWRWYRADLGERCLIVNIPNFTLNIVENGWVVGRMRAIVGRSRRQTPTLSGRITYLEFNPYWNIPRKIARRDILPKAIDDPTYLVRQGIRIFDGWDLQARALDPATLPWKEISTRNFPYRLRQDPSDVNALGQVKFIFPNPHSVYIHDTPGKALFNRLERSLSSGCVRVEDPLALAQYLLGDQGWDQARLDAIVARKDPKSVVLRRPMPVHLVYFTAWADADGVVNFRKDVYDRDRDLLTALQNRNAELIFCNDEAVKNKLLADGTPSASKAAPSASGRTAAPISSSGKMASHSPTGL